MSKLKRQVALAQETYEELPEWVKQLIRFEGQDSRPSTTNDFWDSVERTAKEVDEWPSWRLAGLEKSHITPSQSPTEPLEPND